MTDRPNILILWGDDIGWYNISHNNRGAMGYETPNIDRVAREGIEFTDYYAQQSCTAGRAAFITGQNPVRTGLTKVGIPGADLGLQAEDPTIAELLKPLGYATGQFGKNHLGDKDEFLPSNHGFDEFYGNLYHLNAEDEPEHPDYPKDPAFLEKFGPRGVIHSYADGRIEDTGPLSMKRMETIDDDATDRAEQFIRDCTRCRRSVLRLVERHPDARVDPNQGGVAGALRTGFLQRCDGRTRRPRRPVARCARRARHRRQHHRHVLDRQRTPLQHVAGRRHHAVAQ